MMENLDRHPIEIILQAHQNFATDKFCCNSQNHGFLLEITMGLARKHLICVDETPYYHVVSRCVRRAFLCGEDKLTGRCFEHRRQWLVDRIKLISSIFDIDVCSYAIMSNHFHIVLRVGDASEWPANRVLMTWQSLCSLPVLCDRYLKGEINTEAELRKVKEFVSEYRARLMSVSWFMKFINEYIARMANAEDKCTGHFANSIPGVSPSGHRQADGLICS